MQQHIDALRDAINKDAPIGVVPGVNAACALLAGYLELVERQTVAIERLADAQEKTLKMMIGDQ